MNAERREIGRVIKSLRTAIETGDVASFTDTLNQNASPQLLIAVREQKLLLKAADAVNAQIGQALKQAAQRALPPPDAAALGLYVDFIPLWRRVHVELVGELNEILAQLPKMDTGQLIELYAEALSLILKAVKQGPDPHGRSVAEYERDLGEFSGYLNDTVFAGLRALNEAARRVLTAWPKRLSKTNQERAWRRLAKAIVAASKVNALETVLDWVTYGDLVVSAFEAGASPRVRLDYADPRRSLLRILAIRRDLVLNLNHARGERVVRNMLKASEAAVLREALAHYADLTGIVPDAVEQTRLAELSMGVLLVLNAEDDMLALADQARASTYYLTSMCLRWFDLAAGSVRRASPRSRRRGLAAPILPVDDILAGLARSGVINAEAAVNDLTSPLPARSHYNLARRPFVRAAANDLRSVPRTETGVWAATVRETLIKGGDVGDAYGRLWEKFLARSFQEGGWRLLGQGRKIRRDGKTTTDIDLLLKREDLLLVVQVKAMIGSGLNPYDHWKNRQTIEWGCRQALAGVEGVHASPEWLLSVAGAKVAAEITHVQPVVLTNVSTFDGWRFEGVPVLGEVGLKAIVRGAKVNYQERGGAVIATHHLMEGLTTERILWLLDNPVEMQIAPEGLDVFHIGQALGGLKLFRPEFGQRKAVKSFPAVLD